MRSLWPSDDDLGAAFGNVFDEGDPCPGQPISDRYGLVKYESEGVGGWSWLDCLGANTHRLLRLLDREEFERVERLAQRRAAVNRRRGGLEPGEPDWLIGEALLRPEQEQELLARIELTEERAQSLLGEDDDYDGPRQPALLLGLRYG